MAASEHQHAMTATIDHQTEQGEHTLAVQWDPEFRPSSFETFRMLEEVRDALDRDPVAARASVDRLASFLKIATTPHEPVVVRGGLTPWQKRKVEVHIEERLGASIPIKSLAELVFLSCGHFSRAFKETFGSSPHAHIIRRRVARAKELMLKGHEPLGQIALRCGFADQAHFTTLFRRFVGKTPSDWRRTNAMLR